MFDILYFLLSALVGYTIFRLFWVLPSRSQLRQMSSLSKADFDARYGTTLQWMFGHFLSFDVDKVASVGTHLPEDPKESGPGDALGDDPIPATRIEDDKETP